MRSKNLKFQTQSRKPKSGKGARPPRAGTEEAARAPNAPGRPPLLLAGRLKNENISRKLVAEARRICEGSGGDGSPGPAQTVVLRNGDGFPSPPDLITPRCGLGTGDYFSSPGMQGKFRAGLSWHSQAPDFGYPVSFRLPNCSSAGDSDAGDTGSPSSGQTARGQPAGHPAAPPGSSTEPLQTAKPSRGLGSQLDRGTAAGTELLPLRARLRVPSPRHQALRLSKEKVTRIF